MRAVFFRAEFEGGPIGAGDPEMLWLDPRRDARLSFHACHAWAATQGRGPMEPFALDARDAWNAGADAFIHFVESGADHYRLLVHGPALLAACGDVRGANALDVGCGQGYFSRLLARAGASVAGVDVSDRLVARAIEIESAQPLGITYRALDAGRIGDAFEGNRFDLVTGCMSLQDIEDPGAVLAGARRLLRGAGRVVFSVPHPCTDPPLREWKRDGQGKKLALCLDRYFDTGPTVCDWNMPRLKYPWRTPYRRYTLTQWCELIAAAGFALRSLREPRPDAGLVAAHPELEDCSRMPYFLIFEIGKPAAEGLTKELGGERL